MRRVLSLIIIAFFTWSLVGQVIFAQTQKAKSSEDKEESKVVDVTADVVYPHRINDTLEVMCLVGNFAAQHNGAVITADSAVRYGDKRLECFGNVLINKNTTYGYADQADYNGEINEITLYAPIIKVVDGDATLYTYNFRFNTRDNIGLYDGGGVMLNGGDVMESITGYYYADDKELIGVGDVEMSGDNYQMTSDSIIYNTETESAQYFTNSNIWNEKDEYLYADAGDYNKADDRYSFDLNGYILTDEQEMWSDSMDYYRSREHVYMRSNVQIDDTTQKSLIFADYGEYLSKPGNTLLHGRPVVVSYDLEQGDSLFMRADTIQIFTLNRFESDSTSVDSLPQNVEPKQNAKPSEQPKAMKPETTKPEHKPIAEEPKHEVETPAVDEPEQEPESAKEEPAKEEPARTVPAEIIKPSIDAKIPDASHERTSRVDSLGGAVRSDIAKNEKSEPQASQERDTIVNDCLSVDSLAVDSLALDSLALDSLALDSLTKAADTINFWQKFLASYRAKRAVRLEEKAVEQAARKIVLDSIGRERQKVINAKLDAEKLREAERIKARQETLRRRAERKRERAIARGKISADDTTHFLVPEFELDSASQAIFAKDSLAKLKAAQDSLALDSLSRDSLALDSLAVDSLAVDSVAIDSLYRLVKGFRNVKMYRSDFQSVADSMTFSSIDSVIHLYIEPVLWHDKNQITSDVMDIYTLNQQVDKAVFTGTPFMVSELDGIYYNQVTGKEMTSLFRDGEIYRNDVDGNAQTIYYMQDDESGEVNGMMVLESGSTTFYIKEQNVEGITYRSAPTYVLYPMNRIPANQPPTLNGFSWQSDKRPWRELIMDRTQRPSQREEKRVIPRPEFPINEELAALRERLTLRREWSDRTDVVSEHVEEWLESLGYKSGQPREN